jgi:IclR family transcriptional regulator, acetate operon repressor
MQNVLNTLRVLEEVAARQPAGVAELARATGIPKSSVQRALRTLQTAGWIRPAGGGITRWAVTIKALYVGRHAGDLSLRDVAVPVMEDLRRRIDETIHLAIPEGDKVVLIERLETSKPVRIVLALGMSLPLHASAHGKAVLAAGSAAMVEQLLADGLPRHTDTTITDPGRLLTELEEIRKRGYSTNGGEWRSDVSAVAAAVMDDTGQPVASISINVPTSRMAGESQAAYGALVREAAAAVGAALGTRTNGPASRRAAG